MSVRSGAVLLAVTTVLAGCGGDDDGGTNGSKTAESCPARLTWEDEEYLGSSVRLPAERGEELGEATIPACGQADEREVRVARIPGVDPSIALGNPEDTFMVWIAETAQAQDYPEALERMLFGLSCDEDRLFTLAGNWVGISDENEPLYVQLDVDRTDAPGDSYTGVIIDLAVRESTNGLNSRDAFSNRMVGRTRLRARVRCVEADRPDRTFLAESIDAATSGG